MTPSLKKSLALVLGTFVLSSAAQAGTTDNNIRHKSAAYDFKTGRSNGVGGISASQSSNWTGAISVDPATAGPSKTPLTATQFKGLKDSLQRVQDSLRTYYQRKENKQVVYPERTMTLDQWWVTLTQADRDTLAQYGITVKNISNATVGPYFAKTSATAAPTQLFVVNQDFFNSKTVTGYKNKTTTSYQTVYYQYPVWAYSGCDICPSYVAYYATASYQVATTTTTQVPSAYQVAVKSVTPHKTAEDVKTTVQVPQYYTDYYPVWAYSGCDICPSYVAYYQPYTAVRYVNQDVYTLVLKDQAPANDERGRGNLFAPAGTAPDANSNITFSTDADGNIIFQSATSAAESVSSDAGKVLSNPAFPKP